MSKKNSKTPIMTIAIDAREALKRNRAGKANYNYHLIKALSEKNIALILLAQPNQKLLPEFKKQSNITKQTIPGKSIKWHKNAATYISQKNIQNYISPTSYITPYYIHKLDPSVKTITTIHDLIVFLHPKGHPFKPKLIEKHFLKKLVTKTNTKFASVSTSTQKDLHKIFPILKKSKRSFVALNGIDHNQYQTRKLKSTNKPTILSVSTILPRKNYKTLIHAFNFVKDYIPHKLIIAGSYKPKNIKPLQSLVNKLNLQDRIQFTGFISDKKLHKLYQDCDFVVIPSLYEGFGLPALESLKQGIPLVCSDIPPFQEVTQGKALYFEATNPVDLANQIKFLHNNQEQKSILQKEGPKQAQKFSWKKTAQAILKKLPNS